MLIHGALCDVCVSVFRGRAASKSSSVSLSSCSISPQDIWVGGNGGGRLTKFSKINEYPREKKINLCIKKIYALAIRIAKGGKRGFANDQTTFRRVPFPVVSPGRTQCPA